MSKHLIRVAVSCLVFTVTMATRTNAQIPVGTTERAVIPFDFIVRGRTLPAGTYTVQRINDSSEALLIESRNYHSHVVFETEPFETRRAPKKNEWVFHRYGDTYFLREIRIDGEEEGRELAMSRAERALQEESARNNAPVMETIALAVY